MKTRTLLAAAILAPALLASPPARGADPDDEAQKLFDRGVDAMEGKRFDKACPDIEASYKLDPRPGTLFTLAECEAQRGRPATALGRYEEYLALYATLPPDKKAKQGDREATARRQRDALGTQAPQVTLGLPPDAPGGTVVRRDGEVVPAAALGAPVRMDPGRHVISAQAPGQPPIEVELTLKSGERKVLALAVHAAAVSAAPVSDATGEGDRRDGSAQRVIGLVVGGVGVAGLVVGGVLGGVAKGKLNSALANCPTKKGCPVSDQAGVNGAGTMADASTAMFVLGGSAIAAGLVVWLTAPSAKPSAPSAWRFTPVLGRTGVAGFVERSF